MIEFDQVTFLIGARVAKLVGTMDLKSVTTVKRACRFDFGSKPNSMTCNGLARQIKTVAKKSQCKQLKK